MSIAVLNNLYFSRVLQGRLILTLLRVFFLSFFKALHSASVNSMENIFGVRAVFTLWSVVD